MTVSGINIDQYIKELGMDIDENIKSEIGNEVKKAGFNVVHGKGYTSYGIGTAVSRIVK